MSYVQTILSLPPGVLFAASAVLIVLFALWLSALFSRRHFITIKRSEETELIAFELGRIADAVEKLASARESQAPVPPSVESPTGKAVGLAMFGR